MGPDTNASKQWSAVWQRSVHRARGFLEKYREREDGIAAVEFAFVFTPFIALLFAVIETTAVFFVGTAVDTLISEAAREIKTGQVQELSLTEQEFRQRICDRIVALIDCSDRLQIDVRTFEDFNNLDFTPALDDDGNLTNNFMFNPGSAGDIVLVRAFYVWHVTTPIVGSTLTNMAGNSRLISSAFAFRNEPFEEILGP